MQITIAALVTSQRLQGETRYSVQTLGDHSISTSDLLLKTALSRLAAEARKRLQHWIDKADTQSIEAWLYDPEMVTTVFKETLTLRDRTVNLKTLLCTRQNSLGKFVTAPFLENFSYQSASGIPSAAQARNVLTDWCEQKLKREGDVDLRRYSIAGDAWIEPIDIGLTLSATKKKKKKEQIGAILGQANPGGAEALQRVGRCLDIYRADQSRLFGRDREAEQLQQLLSLARKQSILLIGPSGAGKTATLQEVVRRRVLQRKPNQRLRKQVWLISPGRVISGMSYLGQWEQRWLSILKEAYRQDHVLYFDDPISLYTAGRTRDCQMVLADVLKSFVAEHPLRILFEMTPQALSILRRQDRTLVDPMTPVAFEPMSEAATTRVLIDVFAEMETSAHCFFHPGLLSKTIEYSSFIAPHQVLPGKAIGLARGLAQQSQNRIKLGKLNPNDRDDSDNASTPPAISISRRDLEAYVEERAGQRLSLREMEATSKQIAYELNEMIVGQSKATEVLSKYAARAIHGLQPSDRPLGVFLFLGPTGVGKTESAKALTRLLFQDESRMVRIDMNEISSSDAAAQLIGTIDNPDGRLPTLLRRQPNCVLLLDEIEKAHPDVLDYLLQVTGEGRLSDAHGRTVDFRNAYIIMTSNLGSAHRGRSLGLEGDAGQADFMRERAFHQAVRQFFRPEFVNRIDEIVIFDRLLRQHMHGIVDRQLQLMKRRDGFSRRRMFVQLDLQAIEWIVDKGYDPDLGARAIKRALERYVAQPLADQLAAEDASQPVLIQLSVSDNRLDCHSQVLRYLPKAEWQGEWNLDELTPKIRESILRLKSQLSEYNPSSNALDTRVSQADYYAIHAAIAEVEERWREADDFRVATRQQSLSPIQPSMKSSSAKPSTNRSLFRSPEFRIRKEKISDIGMREGIREIGTSDKPMSESQQLARDLVRSVSLAHAMLQYVREPNRWVVRIRYLNNRQDIRTKELNEGLNALSKDSALKFVPYIVREWLLSVFRELEYFAQQSDSDSPLGCTVEGTGVFGILLPLLGTYQVLGKEGPEFLLHIDAMRCSDESHKGAESACQPIESMHWNPDHGPIAEWSCGNQEWNVVRGEIWPSWIDYRSGLRIDLAQNKGRRGALLDQLPLPEELRN